MIDTEDTPRVPDPARLRRASRIVLIGDALQLRVSLQQRAPGGGSPWAKRLVDSRVLKKLERAGAKAAKKGLGKGNSVALDWDGDLLVYRIHTHRRGSSGLFSDAGYDLETELLKALRCLVRRVESIVSKSVGQAVAASGEWSPGPGLHVLDESGATDSVAELEHVIADRRRFSLRLRAMEWVGGITAALLLSAAVGSVIALDSPPPLLVIGAAAYGLIGLWMALLGRSRSREIDQEIQDLRDQQDLNDLIQEPRERRAQKLFQVHSQQLKRYYDQALRHRGVIFFAGLLCIGAGFGTVAAAFWLIQGSTNTTEQIVVGALGAVGGILGNFIAVIYLRMFTETMKSIGAFHDRLVLTHHLHFANFLVAKVDDAGLRDTTLASIAHAVAMLDAPARGPAEDGGGEASLSQAE